MEHYAKVLIVRKDSIRGIKPTMRAIELLQKNDLQFTPIHQILLKVIIHYYYYYYY